MIHHISRQHQCQLAQVSADRSHHHSVGECPCWQLLYSICVHVLTVPCLNFVNDLGSWKEDMIISLASNILALNQDRYLTGFGKTLGHDLFFLLVLFDLSLKEYYVKLEPCTRCANTCVNKSSLRSTNNLDLSVENVEWWLILSNFEHVWILPPILLYSFWSCQEITVHQLQGISPN